MTYALRGGLAARRRAVSLRARFRTISIQRFTQFLEGKQAEDPRVRTDS